MATKYQKEVARRAKEHPKEEITGSEPVNKKLADLKKLLADAEMQLTQQHILMDEKKHSKALKNVANLTRSIALLEQRTNHM